MLPSRRAFAAYKKLPRSVDDADSDIAILKEAKAEGARLQLSTDEIRR